MSQPLGRSPVTAKTAGAAKYADARNAIQGSVGKLTNTPATDVEGGCARWEQKRLEP